jgi:hypothetical protein
MTEFRSKEEESLNQLGGLWLFNLLPGLGNALFTRKRSLKKGPMILWLLFTIFFIPGFLKYLVLYFTLSIAGTIERLEDENNLALEEGRSARSENLKPLVRSISPNKNAGFATGNFEKKLRMMDTQGLPVDVEFYDPLNQNEKPIPKQGTGERSVTRYEVVDSLSKDDLEKRFDENEIAADAQQKRGKQEQKRINSQLLVDLPAKPEETVSPSAYAYGTGALPTYANSALDTFANTQLDTSANTKLDTFANKSLETMADTPLETAKPQDAGYTYKFSADLNKPNVEGTLLDCPQCNEPRTHGFSFCPKCAKMFDF